MISRSLADPDPRGCMIVNAALDVAPDDDQLRAVISGYLGEIEAFFRRCLERAAADRDIAPLIAPDGMARTLLAVLLGIRVAARLTPDRAMLEGMLRPALTLVDLANPQKAKKGRS